MSDEYPEITTGSLATGSALLTRLYNHRAMMAPDQKERHTGKLLLECISELERLNQRQNNPRASLADTRPKKRSAAAVVLHRIVRRRPQPPYCPSCGMLYTQCDCWDAVNHIKE